MSIKRKIQQLVRPHIKAGVFPKVIKIIMEKKDLLQACEYSDNHNCLAATALYRRGYGKLGTISVGSFARVTFYDNDTGDRIAHYEQKPWDGWLCADIANDEKDGIGEGRYSPSIIGKTLTLERE